MSLEAIACNQCGAPLAVPEAANYVTCNHCGASLAVRRDTSVTYTEVVEKLAAHTSKLAKEVAELRYQNELARIDREWEIERRQYLVERKNGAPTEPTSESAIIRGLLFAVAGIVVGALMGSNGGGLAALAIGFVVAVAGIVSALQGAQKAADFERARLAYVARRGSVKVEHFLDREEIERG